MADIIADNPTCDNAQTDGCCLSASMPELAAEQAAQGRADAGGQKVSPFAQAGVAMAMLSRPKKPKIINLRVILCPRLFFA